MDNWYKKAQAAEAPIWQRTEEEHAGLPKGDDYEEWAAKRREWKAETQKAVSKGLLAPGQAAKAGLHDAEKARPLPPELYHVTTAKDKVLSQGLRSRRELQSPSGLGGGPDDTVSLTADLGTARAIRDSILVAREFMAGKLAIPRMLDMARKGKDADRPWLDGLEKWAPGGFDPLLTGKDIQVFDRPVNPKLAEFVLRSRSGTAKADKFVPANPSPDGSATTWVRTIPPDEMLGMRMSFFKAWSLFRESAGGPMDPLFWGESMSVLPSIPEDQIAILRVRPKPGAMGTQESALGEWRTWSGEALDIAGTAD